MMMADKRLIDQAAHIDLSRCYAKLDKSIEERKRRRIENAKAAIRAGDDSPWLVLKVMTGREIAVGNDLLDADIETLVPMKLGKEIRKRHRVIPPRKEPIFIGYIFARCIISNDTMAALLSFEYVAGILGGYENPHLVSADKVLSFNEKAESGHFDHEVPQAVFKRGMKVHIRDGIFAGRNGEIVSGGHDGKGNAVVDIDFFGRSTPAIMPLAILEPL
jgi:transcriptional antiterminator NusG